MLDKPRFLLHAEGFAILTVSFAAYHQLDGSWLLFFLLFLWPGACLCRASLANVRLGAAFYNLAHTEVGPLLLGACAVFQDWHRVLLFAIIWMAHIGLDRMLGYGLKYPTFFKDTHFQRIG